ncbi:MAG: hypothetical protein GYB68_19870 [Chloroflexi bacterium]|nr:hypothetical protein [Chloroflexota bacterium]
MTVEALATQYPFLQPLSWYVTVFNTMFIVFFIPTAIAWWRLHEKAGRPGWTGLIPFYNLIVLSRIAGTPYWQGVLCMLSFTAPIGCLFLMPKLARSFGLNPAIGYLSALLPPLIFIVIGFGPAEYVGQKGPVEHPHVHKLA